MKRAVIVRPAAELDLSQARDWYEAQRSGLGSEFLTAVEDRLQYIMDFPESYAIEYRGVRLAGLSRFPYVVYYRLTQEIIEIWQSCMAGAIHVSGDHGRNLIC